MAATTSSSAEPVTIVYMANRILLKRSQAMIGLMGVRETIRCLAVPERTCSPEEMGMTS
jgi:hypothetical protein